MLLDGEEAVVVGRRLLTCQKPSCRTPHRESFTHSTPVEFGCIDKWPWTQFFSRACAVGWLIDELLVLFLWSILWNARRRRFGRVYLGRMAERRCHSGCTILSFWFDSSCCPSVSLIRPDFSVLQANWRGSDSEADFHFPWLTEWSMWRPFLWLCLLPLLPISSQLCHPGNCPSRLLDWASPFALYWSASLIGWMEVDLTFTEISSTQRSGYTETSFCPAIGLLGTLCRAYVVPTGRYCLFCNARCPSLQRNMALGMVESFSRWLGLQQGWDRLSHYFRHHQFHSCCWGTRYISDHLVVFWYFAWAIGSVKAAFLQAAEGDVVQWKFWNLDHII